jgi:hypothetical protein
MLTREDDIDAHALRQQGWTISAIARHLGRDRKTIRAHLAGGEAGVRARSWADPFEPLAAYCAQRLKDDAHLWASVLFAELLEIGDDRSYPTMTRQLRARACARRVSLAGRPRTERSRSSSTHPVPRLSGTGRTARPARGLGLGQERAPTGRRSRPGRLTTRRLPLVSWTSVI